VEKTPYPFFRLHEASEVLNDYVMWVWSDNFTAAFFVCFIVTAFVPDIEGMQNEAGLLWYVYELEQLAKRI